MKKLFWARMSDGRTCIREEGHTFAEYDTCLDRVTMNFMAHHFGGIELVEETVDWSPPKTVSVED